MGAGRGFVSAALLKCESMQPTERAFDKKWSFADPEGTRQAFLKMLAASPGAPLDYRLELRTQIGRTLGLQGRFDEAVTELDSVQAELKRGMPRVRARLLLEQGRCLNSWGRPREAMPFFSRAWNVARRAGEDELAADALHMLAIAAEPPAQFRWARKGLRFAQQSADPGARKWVGPLLNNLGWAYAELGRYADALAMFEESVKFRESEGEVMPILIARYSVGHALRKLGRTTEALALGERLAEAHRKNGTPGAYVQEEIAECLLDLGRDAESRPFFAEAYRLLSQDFWLFAHQPERLERLRALAGA